MKETLSCSTIVIVGLNIIFSKRRSFSFFSQLFSRNLAFNVYKRFLTLNQYVLGETDLK